MSAALNYLMSRGLSQVGAKQFLLGRPMTNPVDIARVQQSSLRNLLFQSGTSSGAPHRAPSVVPRRGIAATPAGQSFALGRPAGVYTLIGDLNEQLRVLRLMAIELADFLRGSPGGYGELLTWDGYAYRREELEERLWYIENRIAVLREQIAALKG